MGHLSCHYGFQSGNFRRNLSGGGSGGSKPDRARGPQRRSIDHYQSVSRKSPLRGGVSAGEVDRVERSDEAASELGGPVWMVPIRSSFPAAERRDLFVCPDGRREWNIPWGA